jgi:hypothetical protein
MKKEQRAIFVSAAFLVTGMSLVFLFKRYLNLTSDALLTSVLFFPVITYFLASDKIAEIKAGGVVVKLLKEAANENIGVMIGKEKVFIEHVSVEKKDLDELHSRVEKTPKDKPVILVIKLGHDKRYNPSWLLDYIDTLKRFRNFKYAVFLDAIERFIAFMPYRELEKQIAEDGEPLRAGKKRFIDILNENVVEELVRCPKIVRIGISIDSTNALALRKIEENQLDAIAVVDDALFWKGILEREQILVRMGSALATVAASQT